MPAERYASDRIIEIWSPEKLLLERELWIAVLQAQRENGADVRKKPWRHINERK